MSEAGDETNGGPAAEILDRFLASHPGGSEEQFEAWAAAQPELKSDASLRDGASKLLQDWLRAENLLQLGMEFDDRGSVFRRRSEAPREEAAQAPGSEALREGRRIGSFILTRFIAKGGMGQVWEAEDTELRRKVALKLVLPDRIDARSLELFAREARAGGRLNHPNLVTTLAYGTDDGLSWIAQELVEGSWTIKDSLDALRAEDAVPKNYYREVAELVAKIADGMQAVHDAGVIHRDLKPQNILIAEDDTPKVTDFGLARVTDDSVMSQTGDFAGTWAYMSPEQVTAKRMGLDHRTDVFSLGVVMYELLTLRKPFEGDTTHQIAQEIIYSDPPEATKVRSQCPKELSVIAAKAMEKVPGNRYGTMGEFAGDLRRHLVNKPILAKPPGMIARSAKWVRRHPTAASSLAFFTLSFVAIGLLGLDRERTNRRLSRALDNELTQRLVAQAMQHSHTDPGLGMLLALEVAERDPLRSETALQQCSEALHERLRTAPAGGRLLDATLAQGPSVLLALDDGRVFRQDVDGGTMELAFSAASADRATFSPRGDRLLVERGRSLHLFDTSSGALRWSHEVQGSQWVFSDDGRWVFIPRSKQGRGPVAIYSAQSGAKVPWGRGEVEGVDIETSVLATLVDGRVSVHRVEGSTIEEVFSHDGEGKELVGLNLSPDGQKLFLGNASGQFGSWILDVATEDLAELPTGRFANRCEFLEPVPVYGGRDSFIVVRSTSTGTGTTFFVWDVFSSRDAQSVFSVSSRSSSFGIPVGIGREGDIVLACDDGSIRTSHEDTRIASPEPWDPFVEVSSSQEFGLILARHASGAVSVWAETQCAFRHLDAPGLEAYGEAAPSPDGHWIAALGREDNGVTYVNIFDRSAGRLAYQLTSTDAERTTPAFPDMEDGVTLDWTESDEFCMTDRNAICLQVRLGSPVEFQVVSPKEDVRGSRDEKTNEVESTDSQWEAVSTDGSFALLDIRTGSEEFRVPRGPKDLLLGAYEDALLVFRADERDGPWGAIEMWRQGADSPVILSERTPVREHSQDGPYFATCGFNHVRVWDLRSRKKLLERETGFGRYAFYQGDKADWIWGLRVCQDSMTVSAVISSRVHVWPIDVQVAARRWLSRGFTLEELRRLELEPVAVLDEAGFLLAGPFNLDSIERQLVDSGASERLLQAVRLAATFRIESTDKPGD